MTINAVKVHTGGSLLADSLASNDSEPFGVLDAERIVVLVGARSVSGFVMAASTSDVMLITELQFLELIHAVVVVVHVRVQTLLVLVLADDQTNDLRLRCWLWQFLKSLVGVFCYNACPCTGSTTTAI